MSPNVSREDLSPGRARAPMWWLALGSLFLPLLVACRAKTVEELRADRERRKGVRGRWEHEVHGFGRDKRGAHEGSFVMTRVANP